MDESEPRAAPEPAPAGDGVWRALFEGGSPRAILARLVDGDPLGLHARCRQRVRAQCLILDERRLHLRTVAHVARQAISYRGTPPLDVWIAEQIRRASGELLDEDTAARAARELPAPVEDERLLLLARILDLQPDVIARGASAFNRATYDVRSTFCALVLEGRDPAEWAAENGTTVERAMDALRRALWILGARGQIDLDELLDAGEGGAEDES